MLLDLRLYYKITVIKKVWYWYKKRHSDQWNRIESSEINTHTCGQWRWYKRGKDIQQGKASLFIKWCWENLTAMCKRMKLKHFFHTMYKNKLRCIKELYVRPEIIKLLEESIGSMFFGISLSNNFWICLLRQEK